MQMEKAKIGVGIVTYRRPEYFKHALASVHEHLGFVDHIAVYHDGPLVEGYPQSTPHGDKNHGVAYAKNKVLRELMDKGCEYIFLMEDDMEIVDPMAVTGYIAAYKMTGFPHLNFHGHGENTEMDPLAFYADGVLFAWPNCVGAWCFYTREAIEHVGDFDENFVNAYEHVEHSWRIYKPFINYGIWPDVIGSEDWIHEQPDALRNSSIRDPEGKWQIRIKAALDYWRSKDPECPVRDPNWEALTTKELDR